MSRLTNFTQNIFHQPCVWPLLALQTGAVIPGCHTGSRCWRSLVIPIMSLANKHESLGREWEKWYRLLWLHLKVTPSLVRCGSEKGREASRRMFRLAGFLFIFTSVWSRNGTEYQYTIPIKPKMCLKQIQIQIWVRSALFFRKGFWLEALGLLERREVTGYLTRRKGGLYFLEEAEGTKK